MGRAGGHAHGSWLLGHVAAGRDDAEPLLRGGRSPRRILDAMMPHLFVDTDPPAVAVAALGDLGGAIGASLLVSS